MNGFATSERRRAIAVPLACVLPVVLAMAGGGVAMAGGERLATRALYAQDFEKVTQPRPPWPVRDNSGWAGTHAELAVVDGGDARHGRLLECKVAGFGQLILGSIRQVARGGLYRVSMDVSSTGMRRAEIVLRRGRSPYTKYITSVEVINESMRRVSFVGKSAHGNPQGALLMLLVSGVTTLRIDNIKIEEVTGDLPPGAPPVPGNLVLNAGFELGWDGWYVRGEGRAGRTANAFEGRRAATLLPGCLITSSWLRLSLRSDYFVQARIRSVGEHASVRLGMSNFIFPRGSSGTKTQAFEVEAADGWKRVGFRWRPPASPGKITDAAECYFVLRNTGPAGEAVVVDGVEVKAALPDTEAEDFAPHAPLELAVSVDAPQGVATKGERVTATVLATSEPAKTSLEIRDEAGKLLRAVPLAFSDRRARLVLDDLPCGYWQLVTAPTAASPQAGRRVEGEALLAVVPPMPAVPIDQWTYGCHIPDDPFIRKACWKLGLRWDRFHNTCKATKWHAVQPTRGAWVFDDARVARHRSEGHAPLGSLAAIPAWAPRAPRKAKDGQAVAVEGVVQSNGLMTEATYPLWEDYARRCAAHWKGTIDVWEITNEPNLSGMSPADYIRLLIPASRGIKAGNPQAVVVALGGATPMGNPWACEAIALGAARHADVVSCHGYGSTTWSTTAGPERLTAAVGRLREALRKAGTPDVPIWDSETGVSVRSRFTKFRVPHGGPALEAATMFATSAAAARAAGLQRVFYYTGHATNHAGDGGARWLCDFNGAVKMPAVPLAVAISLLEGTQYRGTDRAARAKGVVDLQFAGPRGTVRMLWSTRGRAEWQLPKPYDAALNMWGRPLDTTDGTAVLGQGPVYVIRR